MLCPVCDGSLGRKAHPPASALVSVGRHVGGFESSIHAPAPHVSFGFVEESSEPRNRMPSWSVGEIVRRVHISFGTTSLSLHSSAKVASHSGDLRDTSFRTISARAAQKPALFCAGISGSSRSHRSSTFNGPSFDCFVSGLPVANSTHLRTIAIISLRSGHPGASLIFPHSQSIQSPEGQVDHAS